MADGAEAVGRIAAARSALLFGSLELAPAQNALPCAASTVARISGSLSISVKASAIWLISVMSKKLNGGRWISMVATWPLLVKPISVNLLITILDGVGCEVMV
jgi:hypothetical protein